MATSADPRSIYALQRAQNIEPSHHLYPMMYPMLVQPDDTRMSNLRVHATRYHDPEAELSGVLTFAWSQNSQQKTEDEDRVRDLSGKVG